MRSVREHATLTLAASTSSVALVMLAAVVPGASRSVTPPIMMLTTAKVPAERRRQQVAMKRQQGAPWICGFSFTHRPSCVWRCRTRSRPAPGIGRCTGQRPGAATRAGRMPSLIGRDTAHQSNSHVSVSPQNSPNNTWTVLASKIDLLAVAASAESVCWC